MEGRLLATIPNKSEIKVKRNKDEAADGKLDLSDAELVQNFSTSEAMPLTDHRDRRRDLDVLSLDRRPGVHTTVCTDIHVTSRATSVLSEKVAKTVEQRNESLHVEGLQCLDTKDDATTQMHS